MTDIINLNPYIFREYDIRGQAEIDFTDQAVKLLGLGIGTYFIEKGELDVVVCHDNRKSSPRIKAALNKGLLLSGCNVIDIGLNPTPLCYFALEYMSKTAGVMIMGSHNPPEDNGLKISSGGSTIYGADIQRIKEIIVNSKFSSGLGGLFNDHIRRAYLECLTSRIILDRPLKIVVDAGNGTAGELAVELYSRLGCQVIPLYCNSDPNFPNHHPDPTVPDNLRDLQQEVLQNNADVGLAFDGDGDRLGVVDNQGKIVWGDILQILFWREILPKNIGTPVIVEVKCSQSLVEEAKRLGSSPFFYKTGHSLIKAKMKEVGALFTGEMSGHFFFADEYFGYDDALYTGARLLRLLSRTNQPISSLLEGLTDYFSTPEIRLNCPDHLKQEVVHRIKTQFKNEKYQVVDVDGARVLFPGGWGLLRASNTQAVIVMRAEARDLELLKKIEEKLRLVFNKILNDLVVSQ